MPAPEIAALRSAIEGAARGRTTEAAKVRALRDLRDDLAALLGQVDSYIGDLELSREGAALGRTRDILEARRRADVRDELLAGGRLNADTLDSLGYLSHDRLDALEREGTLEAELAELPAA